MTLPTFPLPNTCIAAQPPFVRISGIYPHLAMWNHREKADDGDNGRWFQQPECGIGTVAPWAGKLWCITYTSHALHEGHDKLFAISPDKRIEIHPASIGGTHACRLIHTASNQLFIGCYAIDAAGNVRVIDRHKLPGRLTAIATHLTDPAHKIYYYTQECSLYEVDVQTLEPTLLFLKPLPGWHAKGAYTAQGRLVVAHNGEEPAPSPHWQVSYPDTQETVRHVEQFLHTPITYGPEDWGVLGEFDGTSWRVISRRQHNDVMGPGGDGLRSSDNPDEPIWAQGWDQRSLLLHVCHAGQWSCFRLPKGSYTYDGYNGSYTEWPRFRAIGADAEGTAKRWLMCMHGTFFEWSPTFRPGAAGGVRPLCTYQRYIPDFGRWGDDLVLAGQDASRIGAPWAVPGHAHSNLQFIKPEELETWGPRSGFGGVWRDTPTVAGGSSDPFLVAGYDTACLHLAHNLRDKSVVFTLEADADGSGTWTEFARVEVPSVAPGAATAYSDHRFAPAAVPATWIRVRCGATATVTAYLHLHSPRAAVAGEEQLFAGLAPTDSTAAMSGGLLHVSAHNHNLCVLAREADECGAYGPETYLEVDETLAFHRESLPAYEAEIRSAAALQPRVNEDAASLLTIGADGRRFRLPRSPVAHARTLPWTPRDVREVLQERSLANLGGTFYEIPRFGVCDPNELRNLPDYARMRPIASHSAEIIDFTIWRGLLVLSGVRGDAVTDGHIFRDGGLGLWFGAFDDLWKLGAPKGVGGPWLDTPVSAEVPSDAYLMTGFDRKVLNLSHRSGRAATFRLEIDVTGDGTFHPYATLTVPAKETVEFAFPPGYHAHWLRLVPTRSTVASAQLTYM